ncbi:response regulator transcription factor [Streptomyces sp. S1D4-11]
MIAASKGGCALSPEISRKVITEYTARVTESAQKRDAQTKICTLTTREREVLELLSEGLSNQSIAQTLTISPGTVKDHVRSICSKLDVECRFHAARVAWQANELRISA